MCTALRGDPRGSSIPSREGAVGRARLSVKKESIGSRRDGDRTQKGQTFRDPCGCHVGVLLCALDENSEALGWRDLDESPLGQASGPETRALTHLLPPCSCMPRQSHDEIAQAGPLVQYWVSKALHLSTNVDEYVFLPLCSMALRPHRRLGLSSHRLVGAFVGSLPWMSSFPRSPSLLLLILAA